MNSLAPLNNKFTKAFSFNFSRHIIFFQTHISDSETDVVSFSAYQSSQPSMFERLVPLGSWCRAAHQCRAHAEGLNFQKTKSGPFDWTITPFRSLSKIIRNEIDLKLVLNPIDSYINRVGSVTCGYTGITFHHHLTRQIVNDFGGQKNDQTVPRELLKSNKWIDTKKRFAHTLENFKRISTQKGNLYVRWMRNGRQADSIREFPDVFDGEHPSKLKKLLRSQGLFASSGLIHVTTEVLEGATEPIKKPIKSISKISNNCWECIIQERKGFNGDQTYNFKGDEYSWKKLLEEIANKNET